MKKHAKRSLLIPILALFSVVTIVPCCYMAQALTAYGEDENQANLQQITNLNQDLNEDTKKEDVKDESLNSWERNITATIHYSTNELLQGVIEKEEISYPFIPTTTLVYNFNHTSGIGDSALDENLKEFIVYGIGSTYQLIHIYVPNFYVYCGSSYNWIDAFHVDITILINHYYYVTFDANGGYFADVDGNTSNVWNVAQVGGAGLRIPQSELDLNLNEPENSRFVGWFTAPWGGSQVFEGVQVPEFEPFHVLYAHYEYEDNPEELIDIHFMQDNWFKQFYYKFRITFSAQVFEEYTGFANNISLLDIYKKHNIEPQYYLENSNYRYSFGLWQSTEGTCLSLQWPGVSNSAVSLEIYPLIGEHFVWGTLNGDMLPENFSLCYLGINNIVVMSTAPDSPGYITVASDNGNLFKCVEKIENWYGSFEFEFVTDSVSIFVGATEEIEYIYGPKGRFLLSSENNGEEGFLKDYSGVPLTIKIIGLYEVREYTFCDNLSTLFDWSEMNSYIKGASLDGEEIPVGYFTNYLINGYHTFTLKMSDVKNDTTVTYNANGGSFSEGKTSMTLDATYGEKLPTVENPSLPDNDFIGWFTDPEGGEQVDLANYNWKPSDKWIGVTLYAHWAYNPQPVPPEPGPTPEPVNPDVPGGGGTAQTGDSMPLAPIAALAVIAALGCGLAIRKEYF